MNIVLGAATHFAAPQLDERDIPRIIQALDNRRKFIPARHHFVLHAFSNDRERLSYDLLGLVVALKAVAVLKNAEVFLVLTEEIEIRLRFVT